MGLFDTIRCEYLLPDRRLQEEEFQTKDLECLLETYTITADGRLVRKSRPRVDASEFKTCLALMDEVAATG